MKIFNTLTRQKEEFVPLEEGKAASLCHCASIKYQEKKDISTCYDLAPIYLRKSQAEVQYEEKQRKLKNDL